jgi:predicted enzyme related to lactoylglutathione lyase
MMGRVTHFEIHADEPERAVRFYETCFGWRATKWGGEEYWLVSTGEGAGIDGGILKRMGPRPIDGQPVSSFVCTMQVEDLDAAIALVEENGGIIALPKMAIPKIGWQAYARDPEGNVFGMHQRDPGAG